MTTARIRWAPFALLASLLVVATGGCASQPKPIADEPVVVSTEAPPDDKPKPASKSAAKSKKGMAEALNASDDEGSASPSSVETATILGALKQSDMDAAMTDSSAMTSNNPWGYPGGASGGSGGLGLTGVGRGGGGTGASIGLGRVGTAHPRSTSSASSTSRRPRVRIGKLTVHGQLDKAIVHRKLRREVPKMRYCYQRELTKKPKLSGLLEQKFVVSQDGKVRSVATSKNTLRSVALAQCISRVLKRIRFPNTKGGVLQVTLPIVMTPPQKVSSSALGLGHLGSRGMGVGTGGGLALTGSGSASTKPHVLIGALTVSGKFDIAVARRKLRQHRHEMKSCYEREVKKSPKLKGMLHQELVISPQGTVAAITTSKDTLQSAAVKRCIKQTMIRMIFPKPPSGVVRLKVPLVFAPGVSLMGVYGSGLGGGGRGGAMAGSFGMLGHSGSGFSSHQPRLRMGKLGVVGQRTKTRVRRELRRRVHDMRNCYRHELKKNPRLRGTLEQKFVISPDGKVGVVSTSKNTLRSASLAQCVSGLVKRVRFPTTKGGVTRVTFSIVMTPPRKRVSSVPVTLSDIGIAQRGFAGTTAGSGHGSLGRKRPLKIYLGSMKVSGGVPREIVRRSLRSRVAKLRSCYQNALNSKPKLTGRLALSFVVSASGQVEKLHFNQDTMKSSKLKQCVRQVINTVHFPQPNGKPTQVSFPLIMTPPLP